MNQDLAHAVAPEAFEGGVLLLGEAVGALDPVLAQELAESLGLRLALNSDHANAFLHPCKRIGSAYALRGASP
jgi:ABC-type proline/glycine betaine transport system ATPase subunit